ncbi:MAG: DUF4190 domain-containing protein [Candidatus Alcyoniella australis]|nr:DUF4190 domain-containing protein [Candidatus Alcyoniella australis]
MADAELFNGVGSMRCACGNKILAVGEQPAQQPYAFGQLLTPLPSSALRRTHPMAIAALALGLCGIMLSIFCVGLPLSVLALAAGVIALSAIAGNPQNFEGLPLAWIGIAGGALGLLVSVGWLIYIFVLIGSSEGYAF